MNVFVNKRTICNCKAYKNTYSIVAVTFPWLAFSLALLANKFLLIYILN